MKRLNIFLSESDYKVLDLLLLYPDITSLELAEKLKVTPVAISKILKKLKEINFVYETEEVVNVGKGRPRKKRRINRELKKIVGVNFGSDFIDVSVSHIDGSIIETRKKKFFMKKQDSLVQLLLSELEICIKKYGANNIVGIGLALNGTVDPEKKMVIFSPHFKWKNLKISEIVEEKYNIPTIIENDVRAMLIAERRFGSIRDKENLLYLYMKNGIGMGMRINGRMFRGSNFHSGEFGHFVINKNSNFVCKCGKVGCIETEFSENSIKLMVALEFDKRGLNFDKEMSIQEIYERGREGDECISATISNISFRIGEELGNIMNVLDIRDVVVAGNIIKAGESFKSNFIKGIKNLETSGFNSKIEVHTTALGDNVEKYGAISLVMRNLFKGMKLIKLK